MVRGHPTLGGFAGDLLREVCKLVTLCYSFIVLFLFFPQGPNHARKGVDAGDHPPLTPVGIPGHALSGDESRLYDLIARHFIASLSRDAKYLVTKAVFASVPQNGMDNGETFTCRGKEEIDPGFMRVYGRDNHDSEVSS